MNPISKKLITGTVGELLVQLRLLQFDVQAAPPLRDSGNDLIGIRGEAIRAIQVRSTETGIFNRPNKKRAYHILAVVLLKGDGENLFLDETSIFLIPREEVRQVPRDCRRLNDYKVCRELVNKLFTNPACRSANVTPRE